MTWGFVAAAAVTVVGSVVAGQKANKAAKAQNTAELQNETATWDQNLSDNKAIAAANLSNQIRTGFKVGLLNVQRGQAKAQAASDGWNLSKTAAQLTGSATANAAAAGSIGHSVDAVQSDIQSNVGQAQNQIDENYFQQEANFDTQLYDILTAGQDVLKSSVNATVTKNAMASGTSVLDSLGSAALQIGGSYAQQNMSLGLGSTTTTSAPLRDQLTFDIQPTTLNTSLSGI